MGLIGGEAKGELDSPNAALAKAIQVSHDFLYRAVRVLNVPINDVAIPFVVLCGGLVQFGAIYSPTQEFYPVPVLVTPPLHLYSNVRGVGRACNLCTLAHAALVTYATGGSTQTALATADGALLRQVLAAVCSESRLCAPCVLHQLLYACEALQHVVVFPIGFIGYPANDETGGA